MQCEPCNSSTVGSKKCLIHRFWLLLSPNANYDKKHHTADVIPQKVEVTNICLSDVDEMYSYVLIRCKTAVDIKSLMQI